MSPIKFILLVSIIGISITKISAQEITMFPGFWDYKYYHDDIRVSTKEVKSLMQNHALTKMYWKKSKSHKRLAIIAFGSQLVTSFFALKSLNNRIGPADTNDKVLLAASLSSGIISIWFSLSSASLKKKSILTYNKLQSTGGILLNIGQTNNGIGLVCSF